MFSGRCFDCSFLLSSFWFLNRCRRLLFACDAGIAGVWSLPCWLQRRRRHWLHRHRWYACSSCLFVHFDVCRMSDQQRRLRQPRAVFQPAGPAGQMRSLPYRIPGLRYVFDVLVLSVFIISLFMLVRRLHKLPADRLLLYPAWRLRPAHHVQ